MSLVSLINFAVTVYVWIIIAAVVLSWLVGFNVVNPYNPAVRALRVFCERATEPVLRPIRRFMPDLGGLDISPIVAIILLQLLNYVVVQLLTGGRLFS